MTAPTLFLSRIPEYISSGLSEEFLLKIIDQYSRYHNLHINKTQTITIGHFSLHKRYEVQKLWTTALYESQQRQILVQLIRALEETNPSFSAATSVLLNILIRN